MMSGQGRRFGQKLPKTPSLSVADLRNFMGCSRLARACVSCQATASITNFAETLTPSPLPWVGEVFGDKPSLLAQTRSDKRLGQPTGTPLLSLERGQG